MPISHRNPREIVMDTDAEYQRLAREHSQYEAELERLTKNPYLSSEDILKEIHLKKLKLRVKDRMEEIVSRRLRGDSAY